MGKKVIDSSDRLVFFTLFFLMFATLRHFKKFSSLQSYFESFNDLTEKQCVLRIFSSPKLPLMTSVTNFHSPTFPDLTYHEMLLRLRQQLNIKIKKTPKFREPEIFKDGKSKTIFANFLGLCSSLQRDKKHVMQFIRDELMVKCSLDVESTKMVIEVALSLRILRRYLINIKLILLSVPHASLLILL